MPLIVYNPDGKSYTWEHEIMKGKCTCNLGQGRFDIHKEECPAHYKNKKFDHQQEFPRMAHEVPPTNSIDDLVTKIKEMNTGYVAKEPTELHPDNPPFKGDGIEVTFTPDDGPKPFCGACGVTDPNHAPTCPGYDGVKSPDHYAYGGIETIDYIKAKLTPEQFTGYLWGNVLKYISRFDKKEGIKDLKKAKVYIDWLVEQYDARLVYPNK